MKQLWAPWRTEYIGRKEEGCIFCSAPGKDPKDGLVLFKGSFSIVMLNKYPYTGGHLMVSPLRHVGELEDLTTEESADIMRLLSRSVSSLKNSFGPEGFNIGMNIGRAGGAGFEGHVHVHVVPRWQGDTNFMPVVFDTKVISEHLESVYLRLKPLFDLG